jgi:hypothetical protein
LEKLKVGDLLMREQPGYILPISLKPGRDKNYELRAVGKSKAFEAALDKQKSRSNTKQFSEVAAHADPHLMKLYGGQLHSEEGNLKSCIGILVNQR